MFPVRFALLLITTALLLVTTSSGAPVRKETVRGYLVDLVCVKDQAVRLQDLGPNHNRKCLQMPACVQGGYAVLLSNNEVLAFDERGNELARKLIASRHREKGFAIKATGTHDGDRFHVLRIE